MVAYTNPLAIPYPSSSDTLKDALLVVIPALANQVDDLLSALSAVAPVGWTNLALGSGYTAVAGLPTQYARAANQVTVAFAGTKTTIPANDVIATLPVGFRPSRALQWVGSFGGAIRTGVVLATGEIETDSAFTTGVSGTFTFPL